MAGQSPRKHPTYYVRCTWGLNCVDVLFASSTPRAPQIRNPCSHLAPRPARTPPSTPGIAPETRLGHAPFGPFAGSAQRAPHAPSPSFIIPCAPRQCCRRLFCFGRMILTARYTRHDWHAMSCRIQQPGCRSTLARGSGPSGPSAPHREIHGKLGAKSRLLGAGSMRDSKRPASRALAAVQLPTKPRGAVLGNEQP